VSDALDKKHRAAWGQFFTPAPVAAFLADLIILPEAGGFVVLDPGAGTGSLAAAVAAKAVAMTH
jgi:adenine-specific DNA-methyltransferase